MNPGHDEESPAFGKEHILGAWCRLKGEKQDARNGISRGKERAQMEFGNEGKGLEVLRLRQDKPVCLRIILKGC
jgi:hypothetical protein